jgi:hypothetical protein
MMGSAAYNRGSRLVSKEADERMPLATARADRQAHKDEVARLRKQIATLERDLRRARDKRYVGVQHGPQSYHRGFAYGGASALEDLAQVARTLATITAKEARAPETKAKKGKRK